MNSIQDLKEQTPRASTSTNFPATSTPLIKRRKQMRSTPKSNLILGREKRIIQSKLIRSHKVHQGNKKNRKMAIRKFLTSSIISPIQSNVHTNIIKPSTSKLEESLSSSDEFDDDNDCIIIDKKPEIIVIEDEVTFEDGEIRPEDETKESSMELVCPECPIISNIKSDITSALSNFYEDVTPSFGDLSSISENVTVTKVPLYETINSSDDTTMKFKKSCDPVIVSDASKDVPKPIITDDSVIFVSEEIDLDKFRPQTNGININKPSEKILRENFIPLDDGNDTQKYLASPKRIISNSKKNNRNQPPFKKFRDRNHISDTHNDHNLPQPSGSTTLNSAEKKLAQQYNTNTYNPNKDKELKPGKRMVIIDGSNVAFAHSCDRNFSVDGIRICLEYFDKMGHEVKVVVPRHRLKKSQSTKPEILDKLHREGKIVFTPSKNLPGKSSSSYDDRFILQLALEFDAAIVSNDNYRDLIDENPAFKKIIENRVIGYTWCNDMFLLPKDPYGRLGPTLSVILNRL